MHENRVPPSSQMSGEDERWDQGKGSSEVVAEAMLRTSARRLLCSQRRLVVDGRGAASRSRRLSSAATSTIDVATEGDVKANSLLDQPDDGAVGFARTPRRTRALRSKRLSRRPLLPQVAEFLKAALVGPPIWFDLHPGLEEDALGEKSLKLLSCARADLLECATTLADDDTFLAFV